MRFRIKSGQSARRLDVYKRQLFVLGLDQGVGLGVFQPPLLGGVHEHAQHVRAFPQHIVCLLFTSMHRIPSWLNLKAASIATGMVLPTAAICTSCAFCSNSSTRCRFSGLMPLLSLIHI